MKYMDFLSIPFSQRKRLLGAESFIGNYPYFYFMNWKEAIVKYFPDVWQYLVIIVIFIIAAIFIL